MTGALSSIAACFSSAGQVWSDTLVTVQLDDRRELQTRIRAERRRHAEQVLFVYREAARYRLMRQGEIPRGREPEQPVKASDGTRPSQRGQRGPGLER
jgi:hypothetical protein